MSADGFLPCGANGIEQTRMNRPSKQTNPYQGAAAEQQEVDVGDDGAELKTLLEALQVADVVRHAGDALACSIRSTRGLHEIFVTVCLSIEYRYTIVA